MSELKTGYIYKVFNSVSDKIYIGSTFNAVRKRFNKHKKDYKQWKKGKCCFVTSYKLFDEDFNNVKWGIIEEVKVMNRKELEKIEGKHIMINKKKCVNRCMVGRTRKEYREQNKKKIANQLKEWRELNKEKIKEYREANKEKLKEKAKEKIECEFCGCSAGKSNLKKHQRTKKCLKAQEELKKSIVM